MAWEEIFQFLVQHSSAEKRQISEGHNLLGQPSPFDHQVQYDVTAMYEIEVMQIHIDRNWFLIFRSEFRDA